MGLLQILALSLIAFLLGQIPRQQWFAGAMLIASLLAIYWLQPSTPIRNLDFWLPTASILLTVIVWVGAQSAVSAERRHTLASLAAVASVIMLLSLTRYMGPLCCLTASRPPSILPVAIALLLMAGLLTLMWIFPNASRLFSRIVLWVVLGIFILLKTPSLAQSASAFLRSWSGQAVELASPSDLSWLGFSYLAFRLIHVLRDDQAGKFQSRSLVSFINYALFFPAYVSGPIDRWQRWNSDLQNRVALVRSNPESRFALTATGFQRILIGSFKKFALADSLALLSLNSQNAEQVVSTVWLWVLLFGYAWRIYFDFSGYTDIAIGLGNLMGFRLPENFDHPYLKTNLTAFWNSWHMTLAQWFRAYLFNPLTRTLRMRPEKLPPWLIILIGQTITMTLIGLWHGVAWNFLIWGLWHGVGLFVHNRWADWMRARSAFIEARPTLAGLIKISGWALTFLFVALGWVWFALPDLPLAWQVFQKLAGH
jgi:D-alanyl-lipoteichoic acid acyltransferase DltB (MBOAT superfamily)